MSLNIRLEAFIKGLFVLCIMGNFKSELKEIERYQVIPRDLIQDTSLSVEARFIYCYMAAKPDNWEFYRDVMCRELGMSIKTLHKYIKQLADSGWLEIGKQKAENGTFTAVSYILKARNKSTVGQNLPHGKNCVTQNLPHINNIDNKDIIDTKRIKEYKEKESEEPLSLIDGFAEEEDQNLKAKKEKEERGAAKEEREKTFEGLWKDYGRKGSKAKSLEKFNRLSEEEIGRMKKHIPHYVRSTPDICYRKDMQTYINQKSFNDIIFDKRTNQMLFNPDNPDSVECKENIPKPKRPLWQVYGFPSEEEYKNAYKKH